MKIKIETMDGQIIYISSPYVLPREANIDYITFEGIWENKPYKAMKYLYIDNEVIYTNEKGKI